MEVEMSERTFEQVRRLKREVKKLKREIEMYEAREQRLKDYISELVDKSKERKPRKVEAVARGGNPYGDMLNTVLGNFAGIMQMFEEDEDE